MPKLPMSKQLMPADDYSAEADMHTLLAAHKIKADAKRHAAAKAHAKSKLSAMQALVEAQEGKPDAESAAEDKAEMKAFKRK